jgi:KDO2-lipid IV(A) lauroyltransferase
MLFKYKPRHILEYMGIKFVLVLFLVLPWRLVMCFGWVVAFVAYYVFRIGAKTSQKRIKSVFGDKYTDKEVNRIAWLSFRNFIFNCMELPKLNGVSESWLKKHCDVTSVVTQLKHQMANGGGAILALPHMGGWFVVAAAAAKAGIELCSIAGVQRNPLFNKAEKDLNAKIGIDTYFRGAGEMSGVIRAIKGGKVLAVLPDVRSRIKGVSVDFLGGTANFGRGVPRFSLECNAPIFPCVIVREGWMQHRIQLLDPIFPGDDSSPEVVEKMVKDVMKDIEQAILDHPDQWFWFNKRWVLD